MAKNFQLKSLMASIPTYILPCGDTCVKDHSNSRYSEVGRTMTTPFWRKNGRIFKLIKRKIVIEFYFKLTFWPIPPPQRKKTKKIATIPIFKISRLEPFKVCFIWIDGEFLNGPRMRSIIGPYPIFALYWGGHLVIN